MIQHYIRRIILNDHNWQFRFLLFLCELNNPLILDSDRWNHPIALVNTNNFLVKKVYIQRRFFMTLCKKSLTWRWAENLFLCLLKHSEEKRSQKWSRHHHHRNRGTVFSRLQTRSSATTIYVQLEYYSSLLFISILWSFC